MKKLSTLICVILLINITHSSIASKYRVCNTGGGATYTSIDSAMVIASTGDTIYIDGTAISYSGFTITKPLIFIGPGYFLGENTMTQANPNAANVTGTITIEPGAEGTIIYGIHFEKIVVNADSVSIIRNCSQLSGAGAISISSDLQYIVIAQNFIYNSHNYSTVDIGANTTNVIIANNIILNPRSAFGVYDPRSLYMNDNTEAQITNNIFGNKVVVKGSTLMNNILTSGDVLATSCIMTNNIGNGTQFSLPDNLQNVDMNLVFETSNTSTDGKYMLIDNSSNPALGYGTLGTDCGVFGGTDPYKLSGIPPVPAVYFFFGSPFGSSSNGLPVEIKIKSND